MRAHSWSGNIRELKHVVRVAVLKSRGEIITLKRAGFRHPNHRRTRSIQTQSQRRKSKITAAIAYANGNLTKAASLLGISHRTLWEKRKSTDLRITYHR